MTIDTGAPIEFRLLGPLEAGRNGDALPLGGRKQRALLGVLLLRANEVVSTERLIDELWGAHPPASATHSVEVYVSRLRKVLGAESKRPLIVTRGSGYVAEIAPSQLDVHTFELLCRDGRRALAAGEHGIAASAFADALSLWRGEPLAELGLEGAGRLELARLEELQLTAREAHADAELALGGHAEVVSTLTLLVEAHPFRERLRAQLMLALYRSGRQAEALEVFRDARTRFVEELGLEPGEELRELERRILAHDPALQVDTVVALAQAGRARVPAQRKLPPSNLPHPVSSFVGRDREKAAILDEIASGARLVTLTGPGGSGKTRLAIEVAAALVQRYDACVYWVPLAALRDPSLVRGTISQAIGATDGIAAHVGEREMLVLLDNLEHVIEAAPELTPILEQCPNLALLVTSRELLRLRGEVVYVVPPLAEPDGIALFCERARVESDDSVSALCARLDNLPLAIELAAARSLALTPAQMVERLASRLDHLQGGRDADPRQRTLRATIEWSYDLLSPEEQELFARLAIFRGGCELEAAAEICDANVDTLRSLVEKSLVRFTDERYWMLETVREYAAERLRGLPEAGRIRDRHADHFFALAQRAGPELESGQVAWFDRLDAELDNLRAALDRAQLSGRAEDALRAALSIRLFWNLRVVADEARRRFEALLATDLPPALRADGLIGLIQAEGRVRNLDRAWALAEERYALYRSLDDEVGMHRVGQNFASIAVERGDLVQARELIEPVVARARGMSDWELVLPLEVLGGIEFLQGNYTAALELDTETLAIYERLGDDVSIAGACGSIARSHLAAGDLESALPWLRRSFRLWREIGLVAAVVSSTSEIALVAAMRGDARQAALLLGIADRGQDEAGQPRFIHSASCYERVIGAAKEALGADGFDTAHDEGYELLLDEAIQIAQAVLDDT